MFAMVLVCITLFPTDIYNSQSIHHIRWGCSTGIYVAEHVWCCWTCPILTHMSLRSPLAYLADFQAALAWFVELSSTQRRIVSNWLSVVCTTLGSLIRSWITCTNSCQECNIVIQGWSQYVNVFQNLFPSMSFRNCRIADEKSFQKSQSIPHWQNSYLTHSAHKNQAL